MPSAISCSLSPLISHIHSRLFSDWRRTVSSKYFDTRVPSISTEKLVLPHHARCVLSHLRCNGHSLFLGSYLSRIGRTENPSFSACGHSSQDISHLILHCPATDSLRRSLLATLCLSTTSGPDPEELLGFWGSLVFRHAPIPWKGSDKQQQQQQPIIRNALKNGILKACVKVFGKKKGRRNLGGVMKRCRKQYDKKVAYKKMCENRSEENKARYKNMKNQEKAVVNFMRRKAEKELTNLIQ